MPEPELTNLLNLPNLEVIKYETPDAETAILEIKIAGLVAFSFTFRCATLIRTVIRTKDPDI